MLQDQSLSETSSLLNKHTSFFFNHQASSFIQLSFQTILIFFTMTSKNTSDKDKAFVDFLQQTRSQAFSFIIDSQHAFLFIAFNESNAEIIILKNMKVWKKCIYALNRETDRFVEMKQRDKNEIQQLKAKLQAFIAFTINVIITALLIVIYFEQSKYHKILDSSMFTDEKNSTRVHNSVAQTAQSRTLVLIRLASTFLFLFIRPLSSSSLLHIIYIIMNFSKEVSKQKRLNLTVIACQNNEKKLSIRKIARQHDLSEFTLRKRLNDRQAREIAYISRQKLSVKQEEALAHWVTLMHSWDWSSRVNQVRLMAMKLLRAAEETEELRINWTQRFLFRHSHLISVFSQALNKERATMHDEEVIRNWFQLILNIMKKYDIELKDTYNMNEKSFALRLLSKHRVICSIHYSSTLTQNDNREWVSLIECVCADDEVLKAWYIFKEKIHMKVWYEVLKNDHIFLSENEWTTNEIELAWLQNCFEPETRARLKERYRLLILDEHASHLTSDAIRFVKKNKIILLCLFSHFIDLLQPLDVEIFHSLTSAYRRELETFTRYDVEYSIDKYDFISLYQKAREIALTSKNIQSAWVKSELFLLNSAIVLQKIFAVIKPRPVTSSELTIISSNEVFFSVLFTPKNHEQVNLLIKSITDSVDYQMIMKKMKKACKVVYAQFCLLQKTNKDLLTAARRQQQRATRIKDHWDVDRVMNLDVVEKRAEKTRSKAKDKKNKQMNKELNQTIKIFCRLDSSLFLKAKQRSSVKFRSMTSTRSILLPSTLISSMRISSSRSVRRHRK